MPLIKWCEDISTGIKSIDEEHKVLINLVNALYDALCLNKGTEILDEVMNGLVSYITIHFAHEEEYMFATHYPDYQEHVKEHDRLRDHVMYLHGEVQKGATVRLADETLVFLKSWIIGHIIFCDRAYGPHLKANNIV